jgi:hypothetical protein
VWPPVLDTLQQAGALKAGARGGLSLPRRAGAGAQGGTGASAAADSTGVAPRAASMLRPAGPRAASSTNQQDGLGGKVLAGVRVAESANDALNPASPGATPTANAGATQAPSDELLAEQLNRALIEQAWRSGVDLS